MIELFPFYEYWWFYLGFTVFVLLMLALDLGVFHRTAHEVGFREAAAWSVIWICLALAFNFGLYKYAAYKFAVTNAFRQSRALTPIAKHGASA